MSSFSVPNILRGRKAWVFLAVGILVLIILIRMLNAIFGGLERTNAGEIGVVRNGGPFDNNNIRQVMDPSSGMTWTGFYSTVHKYPAQQRFYTITAQANAGDKGGVDIVHVPSSDGVDMGIEGTLYFSLNLDHSVIKRFDDKFGTRKFSLGKDAYYPWDGDKGWSAFLDQIIRPVIDNDLRVQIGNFRCADLVSSCALVQNASAPGQPTAPAPVSGAASNNNISKIQDAINTSLAADLKATLGDEFIVNLRFNLVRITMPQSVQDAVNQAQAAYAKVSEMQAKAAQSQALVAQAEAEAKANAARQQGYNACPACAQIDIMKSIPPNVTTFAPGQGFSITAPAGKP
ncbi:SPFH domain-containing protein [Yinghuangia seranimata]|uniref:SPFH domain-containing protein n=1 Tax=Yinghuangia seranimata TaxID=408067 RepID=UPI00248CAFAB|nr:SPFH domain-containing protein [Yinghuangia seranimata]MDI2130323.1 SPFH domain-containing protein [Yinghuangia seranimata]